MTPYARLLAVFAYLSIPIAAQADVVFDWNLVASNVLQSNTSYQNPGMASRTMAMVNVAMHDALNSIAPHTAVMYQHDSPTAGSSAEAAMVEAAYQVLLGIYPDQQSQLDVALANSLSEISDGNAVSLGRTFGQQVANTVLNQRANDGFDHSVQYMESGEPGHWQSDPLNPGQQAWGPAWGAMQPFALNSVSQISIPAPPALDSQSYADAFNEVKVLGSIDSTERTQEQTEIGHFWAYDRTGMGTPMRLYNNVLRTIAEQQGNSLHENACLFAMSTVAMADSGIVAWDSKFDFDLWRPVTGIRRADEDGNPYTEADPEWVPLGAPGDESIDAFTPPFPTYLSGHATFGGALFRVLANFYGTDDISFTLTSEELGGLTRTFDSFSEAMAENGRSRVYLGIHWNYDDLEGQLAGIQVADFLSSVMFQVVPEPSLAVLLCTGGMSLCLRRPRPA